MITGINTVFEHDGKKYHLQAEDLGDAAGAFELRVYDQGSVLWLKRVRYDDLLASEVPREEHDKELHGRMEKLLLTVEAAIVKGKIP